MGRIGILLAGSSAWLFAGQAMAAPPVATVGNMGDAGYVVADDWTGFYAGVHAGAQTGTAGYDLEYLSGSYPILGGPILGHSESFSGLLAGMQAGYNWNAGDFLVGVQGTVSFTGFGQELTDDFAVNSLSDSDFEDSGGGGHYQGMIDTSVTSLATFTGKVGFVTSGFLPYVVGGLAVGSVNTDVAYALDIFPDDFTRFENTQTLFGFVVGAGAEAKVADNVSLFGEYNFVHLGGGNEFIASDGVHGEIGITPTGATVHTIKGGVNVYFD